MIKHKITSILVTLSVFSASLTPSVSSAFSFDPSFILSNRDIEDYNSMNINDIQSFLSNQRSFLANYITQDGDGYFRFASEIIYLAAQNNKVNPQWILATLQKEQSLINNSSPTQDQLDWAMGYGVCDDCAKDDPGIQKFRGFGKQVSSAAARIRYYFANPTSFNFLPGVTALIDNILVSIKNQATASLYNYTPHLHGNENFLRIWSRWFAKKYPDGSLLQVDGEPGVWLIQNNTRRPFKNKASLISRFSTRDIISVSSSDLNNYPIGLSIELPNYSIVKNTSGDIYLLVDDEKRKFANPEALRSFGVNPEMIEDVTDLELAPYFEGRTIQPARTYPLGELMQDIKTGGVYFVEGEFKYPIISKEILKTNYPTHKITKKSQEELDQFLTSTKVKLKDGKLVKTIDDKNVYVISNGQRRLIANESTFTRLGYRFTDIIAVGSATMELHPVGEALDLQVDIVSNVNLSSK